MPVFGEDLATEVGRRCRGPVQMMQLNHGIFDEASISVPNTMSGTPHNPAFHVMAYTSCDHELGILYLCALCRETGSGEI